MFSTIHITPGSLQVYSSLLPPSPALCNRYRLSAEKDMAAHTDRVSLLTILSIVFLAFTLPSSSFHIGTKGADCAVPNWHVDAINVTYSDETYTPGTASFVLSNSVTNKSDTLTCPLTFNSLCQILGTPNDETLQVLLQVNIDTAYMTLNQSWTCHDAGNQSVTYVGVAFAVRYQVCWSIDTDIEAGQLS